VGFGISWGPITTPLSLQTPIMAERISLSFAVYLMMLLGIQKCRNIESFGLVSTQEIALISELVA
jgi:hypothetical protein